MVFIPPIKKEQVNPATMVKKDQQSRTNVDDDI
jgi:hypothetical protein